jgi:alpha-glucoside transport system substrate-binding protein
MKKIKMKKRFGLIGTLMVAIFALTGVAHAHGHLKFPIGEGGFTWASYHDFAKAHDYSGQQLTITTRTGGDLEIGLSNALAYFAEATGAKVSHLGNLKDFKQAVVTNHEGGTSPNITGIQLVGFGKDMAKRGAFTPQCYDMANCELLDWFRDNYASGQDWIDSGTWEGPDGKKHWYGPNYFTFHFENV